MQSGFVKLSDEVVGVTVTTGRGNMPQCFHAPTHPIASVPLFALNAIALLALDAIETRLPGAGRVAHLSLSARLAAGAHTLAAAALSPDSPSASHSGEEPAPAASGKMRRLPRHAASRVASPRQEAGRRCAMLCTGGKHAVARRLAQRPAASLLRVEGGLREGAGQAQVRGFDGRGVDARAGKSGVPLLCHPSAARRTPTHRGAVEV